MKRTVLLSIGLATLALIGLLGVSPAAATLYYGEVRCDRQAGGFGFGLNLGKGHRE